MAVNSPHLTVCTYLTVEVACNCRD